MEDEIQSNKDIEENTPSADTEEKPSEDMEEDLCRAREQDSI
jgi:hypothetical protein